MAGIFLGANEIKYNAVPVGNMRVGGTNICKGYVGSVLVFDNCAVANSNVELQLDTSGLSGPSAGYNITGNLAGFTKSGQPNSSYTKFTTNIALSSSSYYWVSGPSVTDAPAGTFPSTPGSTVLVTTTITGQVAANTPTYSDTITVVKSNPPLTTGTAGGSGSFGPLAAGTPYNVPVAFTPATGYNYTLTASDGSSTISLSLNSSSGDYEGTLSRTMGTGTNVTITIDGSESAVSTSHEFQFTTSLLNATATYNVANTSATTSGSAPANVTVSEPYNTSLTPSLTVTTDPGYNPPSAGYTFSASNNQAIQVGVTSSPTVVSVSGTATIASTAVTFYTASGSCANDACINYASGGTDTLHYGSGGPSTGLFEDTGLTIPNTQYAGYHAITTGGAILINIGGGTGALQSCASGSLTQFTSTTFNTTKISACSGPLSDTYYGNGGLLTSSTILYIGNQGCTAVGVGWVSDGNNAVQVSAGGNVIQTQTC
jgi:hypothetical protein